jgi:hypothetical protein
MFWIPFLDKRVATDREKTVLRRNWAIAMLHIHGDHIRRRGWSKKGWSKQGP